MNTLKRKWINLKKLTKALLIGSSAATAATVFLIAPGIATSRQKAPFYGRNFAHRGLHSRDKSVPENSLEAFRRAAEQGYGIELDVQLSKDGYVVVFHDDTLDRVCGVHAHVCDLTFSQLRELRLCGTDHQIPLFTDVLDAISGRTPIICELKTGKRNKELCQKTYNYIVHYSGDICVESFDPFIVTWFRFHAKDLLRGQLAAPMKNYTSKKLESPLPPMKAFLLSRTLLNFLARPQFIAYQLGPIPLAVRLVHALGAMKVAWTSHELRSEKKKDAVIFEFYKPRIRFK